MTTQNEARARALAELASKTTDREFLDCLASKCKPDIFAGLKNVFTHIRRILDGGQTPIKEDLMSMIPHGFADVGEVMCEHFKLPEKPPTPPAHPEDLGTVAMSAEVAARIQRATQQVVKVQQPEPQAAEVPQPVAGPLSVSICNLLRKLAESIVVGREDNPEAARIAQILLEADARIIPPQ